MTERAAQEIWTVARILEWTTAHLRKNGSETPRLDAEILLAQARGCPRIQLYVDFASPLTDKQRTVMRDLVRRRAQHEPVAYLVGHREFFGLDLRVTSDVLVPRPETETLVLEVVTGARRDFGFRISDFGSEKHDDASPGRTAADEQIRNPKSEIRNVHLSLLDVGTGSGCIAVACAVNLPEARVTAIDISPAALAVARENAERHGVGKRLRFLEGDLLAPLASDERFDIIVSNPPYVSDGELETLAPDVSRHEPRVALSGGASGLAVIERLIAVAPAHLAPGGLLLLEISPEQAENVTELLTAQNRFEPARTIKDAGGGLRVIAARLMSAGDQP